jgi:predicted metal-binding protein
MNKEKLLLNRICEKNVAFLGKMKPEELVIEEKVREYCMQNKCGQYGRNFMCPPKVGSVESNRKKILDFDSCLVLIKKHKLINPENREEFYIPAKELHKILLEIENEAKELGYNKATSLIAGNCRMCKPCKIVFGEKNCPYPEKSRPSAEALGINVIETIKKLGLHLEFKKDEVTWVGIILI